MSRVRLRECELRLRNADVLRLTLMERLPLFAQRHANEPWPEVRPLAITIKVEAEACLDEMEAIYADVSIVEIPDAEIEAENRRKAVLAHVGPAAKLVKAVLANINVVIDQEDKNTLTNS